MWRALSSVGQFVVSLLLWVVHMGAFLIGIVRFPVWWPATADCGGRQGGERSRKGTGGAALGRRVAVARAHQRLTPKNRAILHNSHSAHDLNSAGLLPQRQLSPQNPDPRFCSAENACLVPRADECSAARYVRAVNACCGVTAAGSFDQLVGVCHQCGGHREAEGLGSRRMRSAPLATVLSR